MHNRIKDIYALFAALALLAVLFLSPHAEAALNDNSIGPADDCAWLAALEPAHMLKLQDGRVLAADVNGSVEA